jgi:transposase
MDEIERRVWREARAMTRREVMTKALAGQISWVQAADSAGVSARQMRRIRFAIEHHGMSAVMDQRGGRPRRKRIWAGTIAMLVRLKRDVYADFSLRHFYEQVSEKHSVKVSYNWLRLMLQEAGVVEREPGRGQYRRRRERRPMVGMLVHLDASTHQWIAGLAMHDLVVALDDADGRILYARFFAQEGTASTFAALEGGLRRHGRFCALYTDRATHYRAVTSSDTAADEAGGQVSQALRTLGIGLIQARSPQARGRSERALALSRAACSRATTAPANLATSAPIRSAPQLRSAGPAKRCWPARRHCSCRRESKICIFPPPLLRRMRARAEKCLYLFQPNPESIGELHVPIYLFATVILRTSLIVYAADIFSCSRQTCREMNGIVADASDRPSTQLQM